MCRSRSRPIYIAAIVLSVLLWSPANAAERLPQDVARDFLSAMAAKKHAAAADLMSPGDLVRYRTETLAFVADMLGAEYKDDHPVHGVAGVATLGDLKARTPKEFFVVLYSQATSLASSPPVGSLPLLGRFDPGADRQVLGWLAEGDTLAHVMYRSTVSWPAGAKSAELRVLSLRKDAAGWGVLVPSEIMRPLLLFKGMEH